MQIEVRGQFAEILEQDRLVAGTINEYTVFFSFDETWEEYSKIAVFQPQTGERREVVIEDNVCVIPWETLHPDSWLKIGVYGVHGDKRRPTIYTKSQLVRRGAEVGTPGGEPSQTVYDQFLKVSKEAMEIAAEVRKDADEGKFNGGAGPQGPAGTITIGDVETGEPGTSASVTNSGSAENAILEFKIPQGDRGPSGSLDLESMTNMELEELLK